VTLPDSTCRLLVCDFDGGTWRLDAAAYAQAAAWAGVPAAVEISRSGDGAHVWTFFSEPVAAADARAMGAALLREAMAIRGEMDIESYDRRGPSGCAPGPAHPCMPPGRQASPSACSARQASPMIWQPKRPPAEARFSFSPWTNSTASRHNQGSPECVVITDTSAWGCTRICDG